MVLYEPVDVALIRAAAQSTGPPEWPALTGDSQTLLPGWRDWLRRLWQDQELAEAIELASPDLAEAVQEICQGTLTAPRRVRRAVESMTWYLLRCNSRSTPFGMFAGIAPVRAGDHATATWGGRPRAVARPDAVWLQETVKPLESDRGVLRGLRVVLNNLGFERDGALVIPCNPYLGSSGESRPSDVRIRVSRPVHIVMQAARTPIAVADLLGKLSDEFPGAAQPVMERMVADLVARRVLISDLLPPAHITDPLGHLTRHLPGDQASEQAGEPAGPAAAILARLTAIDQTLARYPGAATADARRAIGRQATSQMAAISSRPRQPLAVDLRLDLAAALPRPVLAEAAAAASALVRLAPYPRGNLAWQYWHGAFLDRWGPGAIVAVGQVLHPDTGIGYPAGYRGSHRKTPPATITPRDQALLRLAQAAALEARRELNLDEQLLESLTSDSTARAVYPHTELRFTLHAPTPAAVDRGEFTLSITSATRQAGTSIGRFLHLLDTDDYQQTERAFTALPTLTSGAVMAQMSCPPLSTRAHNLTRTPPLLPLIHLAEHPTGHDHALLGRVALDDLAVTGDVRSLHLVSLSTGAIIEPLQLNAVEFRGNTHPLARFLCELPTALAAPCVPFTWGAAADLPYLPRVRYRRSVLWPATWTITAADLPGRSAALPAWSDAWARLRETRRIPAVVQVGERDMMVGLDLDQDAHRYLLRIHLDRHGQASLSEGPAPDAYGWIGGRPHEIALPLASTAPPQPPPARLTRPRPVGPPSAPLTPPAPPDGCTPSSTPIPTGTPRSSPATCPGCWRAGPAERPQHGSCATANPPATCGCASRCPTPTPAPAGMPTPHAASGSGPNASNTPGCSATSCSTPTGPRLAATATAPRWPPPRTPSPPTRPPSSPSSPSPPPTAAHTPQL